VGGVGGGGRVREEAKVCSMTPPRGSHTIVNMKVDYRIRSQNVWEEANGLGGGGGNFPPPNRGVVDD